MTFTPLFVGCLIQQDSKVARFKLSSGAVCGDLLGRNHHSLPEFKTNHSNMTSSPPSTSTPINTSVTSVPPVNPPINPSETANPLTSLPPRVIFNAPHTRASSQNPLGIYWLPVSMPGVNLPHTEPIHSRPLPFIPPFSELHTPNVNTVPQTPNITPSSKETMRKNIQKQIELMQQQLDALD